MMTESVEEEELEELPPQSPPDTITKSTALLDRFADVLSAHNPVAAIGYFRSFLSLECQARIEAELFTILSEQRDAGDEVVSNKDPQGQVLRVKKGQVLWVKKGQVLWGRKGTGARASNYCEKGQVLQGEKGPGY